MKKVLVCVWLTAIFVLAQHNMYAQGSLGLYTTSISNNNPAMGEEFSLFTKLINTHPVDTFNGIVDFSLANENGPINDINVFGEPQISGTFVTLAPLQEMNLLFLVTPQVSYFVPGPDIIIVWPIASVDIVDSAIAAINIKQPTGINDDNAERLKAYAYSDLLMLQMLNEKASLKHVQIFSSAGVMLVSQPLYGNNAAIPIGTLPSGIYIAEVLTTDGSRSSIKFGR